MSASTLGQQEIAAALNRVADALFTQSKALKKTADAATKGVELSERMVKAQEANLAVTRQLEAALAIQAAGDTDGRPV